MGTAYNPQAGGAFARPGQGGTQQGYRGMAQPQGLTMAPPGAPSSQPARPTQLAPPVQFTPLPAPRPAPGQRPSTRDQVRQSAVPNQPRPAAPGMPLGMPGSMQPFWEQAQQSFPGMHRDQQVDIANKMRDAQERQNQAAQQAMQNQSLNNWHAEQEQIRQTLASRTSSPESVAARQQRAMEDARASAQQTSGGRGSFPQHPLANFLPPFQFHATDFMGNQFNNPGAFTTQQGAMAQALNQQRGQQIGNMFTQGTPLGPLNPFAAYQQGQQMVQGGFANPFMR
jgi:hypothetical protein